MVFNLQSTLTCTLFCFLSLTHLVSIICIAFSSDKDTSKLIAYMLDTMATCCLLSVCVYAVHHFFDSLFFHCVYVLTKLSYGPVKLIHYVHCDGTKLDGDAEHAGSAGKAGAEPSTSTQETTSAQEATSTQEATGKSQETTSTQETMPTNETASDTADSQASSDSLRVFSEFKNVSDSPKKALGGDDSASGASTDCM